MQRWLNDWRESRKLRYADKKKLLGMRDWGGHSYEFVEVLAHSNLNEWREALAKARLAMDGIGEKYRYYEETWLAGCTAKTGRR